MNDLATRELRTRQAEYLSSADRLIGPAADAASSMVVVTVAVSTYPTAVGKYFAVQQLDPGGVEAEGNAATFDTLAGVFYVAVLPGSTLPPVGTKLVIDSVGGRWAVRS